MPIDPNIALQAQTPQLPNISQSVMQGQQMALQRQAMLQMQQERAAQTQEIQQKAAAAQLVAKQNAAVDEIMKSAYSPDPDTGALMLDTNKIQQGMIGANMGHLWPQMSEAVDKMNQSALTANTHRREQLAAGLWALQQAPDAVKPQAAYTVLAGFKGNGVMTPDHVQTALQDLGANPTADDVNRVVQKYGASLPEFQTLMNKRAADVAALQKTQAETAAQTAAAVKSTAEGGIAQRQFAGMNAAGLTPEQQQQAAQAATTAAIERQKANAETLKAQIAQKQFNVTYGANLDAQGNPLTPDAIKAVAQNDPQASMLATYQLPPVSPRMEADPKFAGLMARIKALNPDYDATQYANRSKTRQAFTTGTQGQQVNAMNTAMQHLDLLSDAAQALQNGSLVPGNALYNKVSTVFGGTPPQSFNQIKHYLDGEIGTMVKKGAVTDKEMTDQGATGSSSSSSAQIQTYLNNAIRITASKFNSLHYQAAQALGDKDPLVNNLLMPEAQAVLQKHGINPAGAPISGSGFKVGDTVTVKGQKVQITAIHPDGTFDGNPVK